MAAHSRFIPALEGVRALAALGILTMHVVFQTGLTAQYAAGGEGTSQFSVGQFIVGVLSRGDLWVTVFFALSAFLLWRPFAAAADPRTPTSFPSVGRYYWSRAWRLLPAYWLVVALAFLLVPAARQASEGTVLANLSLTQIYMPLSLTDGLTQMWSLAVEAAFYVVLPCLALGLQRLVSRRWRVALLVAVMVLSVGWAWLPVVRGGTAPVDMHMQLPAFAAWFGVGMVLAELEAAGPRAAQLFSDPRVARLCGARRGLLPGWLYVVGAVTCFVVAALPGVMRPGLVQLTATEFTARVVLGTCLAWCVLRPLTAASPASARIEADALTSQPAQSPARGKRFCDVGFLVRFLESAPLQRLGAWSYGIFLWHVLVLVGVFPMLGIPLFDGRVQSALVVWVVTVLMTVVLSAASYELIERPLRAYGARIYHRQRGQ